MTDAEMQSKEAQKKRDSTNELPMLDLREIVEFVSKIHQKGLEPTTMLEVAKQVGYAAATSTPFYRRVTAARLFGLMSQTGPELTKRAKDYIRPDTDTAKPQSLVDAIGGIRYYAELVEKHRGRKVNAELLANGIVKMFNLTDACASICANAFISSLKFAGMLSSDGVVEATTKAAPAPQDSSLPAEPGLPPVVEPPQEAGTHTYVLPLDREKRRKVTVIAPLDVTDKEIKRLAKWLEVALNPEWSEENQGQP